MSTNGTTSEASQLTDTARRAPATQPHTRLSAALGIAAATAGVALLIGIRFDNDHHVGERLLRLAVLGALLGLAYVGTRLRLREQIGALREAYRLGRQVERSVARRQRAE